MKVSALSAALLVASASAFAPATFGTRSTTSLAAESTRSQFLVQAAGLIGAVVVSPGAANAAKYGSFGAGSPEVLDPKDAIIDEDILKSAPVQTSITNIQNYLSTVRKIQAAIKSNPQSDVAPFVRKEFDFSQLRVDLETLNSAFDEDTQRGTDRVIRLVLQDITELETASKQKEGIARSDRRLEIMEGKLAKLEKAFVDFLAFAQ
mmetsp:Transcript_22426/g.29467  ORF Transcript_22426/g.29467 Transcript_22426/m.29467 type:complete len:206 (-) Transcript_22426:36-653(-)